MTNQYVSCNRAGLVTAVCGKPGAFKKTTKVAHHRVTLIACTECVTKAPESLGPWDPLPPRQNTARIDHGL